MQSDERAVVENGPLTSFDHLPPDVAARVLLGAGGPSCISWSRSVSSSWAVLLDSLVKSAHLHATPSSCSFLQRFPQLSSVDLSGCCEVLPAGGLATLLAGLAELPQLKALVISTWCLAQPAAAGSSSSDACAVSLPNNGESITAAQPAAAMPTAMPAGAPAAAAAAGAVPAFLQQWQPAAAAAAQQAPCQLRLVVPRELGLLSGLQQLAIKPCPGVSQPVVDAALDSMQMCPQVMRLGQLTHLELHAFLPRCHHLRGLSQLKHLALSLHTNASNGSGSGYTGTRAAAALWNAAAATLGAASGLTSLQLDLLGPPAAAGAGAAAVAAAWAGTDWPPALDTLMCQKAASSSSGSAGAGAVTGRGMESSSDSSSPDGDGQGPRRLRELSVAGAGLWHLPAAIRSCCTSLTSLSLSHNRLSEVGLEVLGGAHQLQQLLLDHNCLLAAPACWAGLTQLQVLDLSSNALSSYPEAALSGMSQLQALRLGSNGLALLPEACSRLSCLTELDISSNRLQELPEGLCSCVTLRRLSIARNRLVQLPQGLSRLTSVTQLDLTGNHLSCLPVGLNHMRQMNQLSLGLNYYKQWSNLDLPCLSSSLQLLELQHTATCLADAASFLAAVGRLALLTQLCASNNQLAQLHSEWSALTALQVLRVAHNALEELPPVLFLLPALTFLDISYNRLRCLAPCVSALTGLHQLSAARNHLTSLPLELSCLSRLSQLQLQGNNLAAVPPCLGRLVGLRVVNLGANYKLKEAGLGQLLELAGLRDVVLPYRLRDVGQQLRAAGKAVALE